MGEKLLLTAHQGGGMDLQVFAPGNPTSDISAPGDTVMNHPQFGVLVPTNQTRGLPNFPGFPSPHVYNTDCPGESCDREPLHTWRYIESQT